MDIKVTWKIITLVELAAAVAAVLLDLFMPTLVLVGLLAVSLLVRREPMAGVGLKRPKSWLGMAAFTFVFAFLMQLFDVSIVMPVLNRLSGKTIDYSGFAGLQGNPGQLLLILAVSWTLAAVGEELAYRGYLQKVCGDLFGGSLAGVLLTVVISSVVFGLAHIEQGLTGVVVATIDALCLSWLKRKFGNNLWAAVLAHGFDNTIGLVTFYFIGPIYGLW
jgi:membrane protease YdiL (CAAX protease family)